MKLTPLDIRHKEFKRGMRGYVDGEVDEFLDEVADEFERLFKENIELTEHGEALQEKIDQYRNLEETLQNTLVAAQRSAEELKANAQKEAQLMLSEAELKARQMVNQSYGDKQAVEKQIVVLKSSEQDFRFKFRSLLEGYTKQLTESEDDTRKAAQFAGQAEQIRNAMASDAATHASAPAARPEAPRETPSAPPAAVAATPAASPAATQTAAQAPTPDSQRPAAGPVARVDEARPADRAPDRQEPAAGADAPDDEARPAAPAARVDEARPADRAPDAEEPHAAPEAHDVTPDAPRPEPTRAPAPAATERAGSDPRAPFLGDPDDLLADVDSEVDDNAFKW
jgi:cell division initiation protein